MTTSLLGIEAPALKADSSNLEGYLLWIQVEWAIAYFVIVAIGAAVAQCPALRTTNESSNMLQHQRESPDGTR